MNRKKQKDRRAITFGPHLNRNVSPLFCAEMSILHNQIERVGAGLDIGRQRGRFQFQIRWGNGRRRNRSRSRTRSRSTWRRSRDVNLVASGRNRIGEFERPVAPGLRDSARSVSSGRHDIDIRVSDRLHVVADLARHTSGRLSGTSTTTTQKQKEGGTKQKHSTSTTDHNLLRIYSYGLLLTLSNEELNLEVANNLTVITDSQLLDCEEIRRVRQESDRTVSHANVHTAGVEGIQDGIRIPWIL
jgi:hypothetical protein